MPVPFHLDEHIPLALADALRNRGIDVTTTADAGLMGTGDREHLAFAAKVGRVVITQDVDFLRLHAEGYLTRASRTGDHGCAVFGDVLRSLVLIHAALSPDDMKNRVEYL